MQVEKNVADKVSRLNKGQIVEITWIDACEARNVSSLENEDFATYKTSIGRFLDCRTENIYSQKYVIICEEVTDGEYFEITSVPLTSVMYIRIIGEKT